MLTIVKSAMSATEGENRRKRSRTNYRTNQNIIIIMVTLFPQISAISVLPLTESQSIYPSLGCPPILD